MELKERKNLIKIFLLLIVVHIHTADSVNLFRCSIISSKNCTISDVTLSLQNYTLKPVAIYPNIIMGFEIQKSTVPVITTEICTALPKIKSFVAIQQGIQVIQDYAFNNCTEVTLISMPFNNIHTLGKGIFDNTKQLQEINIHGGSLEQIDVNLLNNLGELLELVISANKLRELPVAAVKNLKKLKVLYLYSNELTDLDAEGLVGNLTSLRAVYINDNNFHCDILNKIINTFTAKNILIIDHTHSIYLKKRDYIPHKMKEIICLTSVEIESEKMKKGLDLSLNELKTVPLGKEVIQLKDIVKGGFQDVDNNIVTLFNTLNATSTDLNTQLIKVNQTLSETIWKMQKIEDKLDQLTDYYKNSASVSGKPTDNSTVLIWIVFVGTLLVIGAVSIFVYVRVKKIKLEVPFSYHRNNDTIPLNEE